MRKAIFIGIDAVQLEKILLLGLKGEAEELNSLETVESYIGGEQRTSSKQATSSGPGWSPLLTGVWVDHHERLRNNSRTIRSGVESIFARFDSNIRDAKMASVVKWTPIDTGHFVKETGGLDRPAIVEHVVSGIADKLVIDRVVDLIANEAPDFTFIHLGEPDGVGHSSGFDEAYDESVNTVSDQLGAILAAVAQREVDNPGEDWLVIVSTDHGRSAVTGTEHVGQSDSKCRTIFASNKELAEFGDPMPARSVIANILDHPGTPSDLEAKLANDSEDHIEIETGAFTDGTKVLSGNCDDQTWNARTEGDLPPPEVVSLSPAEDREDVSVDASLTIEFDEPIVAGSGNIVIKRVDDDSVVESFDVTSDRVVVSGFSVTLDPTEDLDAGTEYYVDIQPGAFHDTAARTTIFSEDFDSLTLDPVVSDTEKGRGVADYTATAPDGLSQENTTPADGPVEFFGWTFRDKKAWTEAADDQRRREPTKASGTVLIADRDEYNDGATDIAPNLFDAFMIRPDIDRTGI